MYKEVNDRIMRSSAYFKKGSQIDKSLHNGRPSSLLENQNISENDLNVPKHFPSETFSEVSSSMDTRSSQGNQYYIQCVGQKDLIGYDSLPSEISRACQRSYFTEPLTDDYFKTFAPKNPKPISRIYPTQSPIFGSSDYLKKIDNNNNSHSNGLAIKPAFNVNAPSFVFKSSHSFDSISAPSESLNNRSGSDYSLQKKNHYDREMDSTYDYFNISYKEMNENIDNSPPNAALLRVSSQAKPNVLSPSFAKSLSDVFSPTLNTYYENKFHNINCESKFAANGSDDLQYAFASSSQLHASHNLNAPQQQLTKRYPLQVCTSEGLQQQCLDGGPQYSHQSSCDNHSQQQFSVYEHQKSLLFNPKTASHLPYFSANKNEQTSKQVASYELHRNHAWEFNSNVSADAEKPQRKQKFVNRVNRNNSSDLKSTTSLDPDKIQKKQPQEEVLDYKSFKNIKGSDVNSRQKKMKPLGEEKLKQKQSKNSEEKRREQSLRDKLRNEERKRLQNEAAALGLELVPKKKVEVKTVNRQNNERQELVCRQLPTLRNHNVRPLSSVSDQQDDNPRFIGVNALAYDPQHPLQRNYNVRAI